MIDLQEILDKKVHSTDQADTGLEQHIVQKKRTGSLITVCKLNVNRKSRNNIEITRRHNLKKCGTYRIRMFCENREKRLFSLTRHIL
jgi:hypothetical protein